MKLNKSALIIGFAGLALLLAGSIVTLNAGDIAGGKGAARLLMKQDAPVSGIPTMASMACTRCIDKYTTTKDLNARGANKPVTFVAQHQCGGCSTQITTMGTGKAKQDVITHACTSSGGQTLTCCTRN